MKKVVIVLLLIVSFCLADPKPIINYLGQTYIGVMKDYGFPNSIFPVRGKTVAQDDVVFMYEFSYMYFYSNKLYRVFYSSEYKDEIFKGIKVGSKKSSLTKVFGTKYILEEESLLWRFTGYLVAAKMDKENRLKSLWFIKEVEK
jgi:hypothetical protein